MGVVQRQSIKGTIVVLVGAAIQYFILLYLLPRFFSIDQFGLFRNYSSLIVLFATIGSLGIGNTIIFNLNNYAEEDPMRAKYNFITLLVTVVIAVALLIVLFGAREVIYANTKKSSPLFLSYFWCIPIGASFLMIANYFEAYSTATFRITVPTLVREIGLRVILLLLIVFFALNIITLTQFYLYFCLSFAVGALVLLIYIIRVRHYNIVLSFDWLKTEDARRQIKFTLFSSIYTMAGIIVSTLEPIIYNLIGAKPTAIYGIALTLSAFMFLPYKALSQIVTPTLKEAWRNNDLSKISAVNKSTANNLTFVGMLFFILILSNFNNILYKIDPQYLEAKTAFIIICISRAIDFATGTNSEILFSSPSYKKSTYFILICLPIYFVTALYCIPKYGVNGAAFVLGFSLLLFNAMKLTYLYKKYKLFPLSINSFIIIIILLGIYFLQQLIPFIQNWFIDAVIRSTVIVVMSIILVYLLKLVPELNKKL